MLQRQAPDRRTTWILITFAAILLVSATASAGTPEDPEIVDPAGDVRLEGAASPPAAFEWADILALWYEEDGPERILLHIRLDEAESIPPPGEVAARITIDSQNYVTGYTTVLAPFAVPMYQGGFACTAAADHSVDPADCETLPDVTVTADVLRVPLPRDVFSFAPGSVIETKAAYSGAWYLDVQTVLDETATGRPYLLPGNTTNAASGGQDGDDPGAPEPPHPSESAAPPASGVEAGEAPGLPSAAVLAAAAGVLLVGMRRRAQGNL